MVEQNTSILLLIQREGPGSGECGRAQVGKRARGYFNKPQTLVTHTCILLLFHCSTFQKAPSYSMQGATPGILTPGQSLDSLFESPEEKRPIIGAKETYDPKTPPPHSYQPQLRASVQVHPSSFVASFVIFLVPPHTPSCLINIQI